VIVRYAVSTVLAVVATVIVLLTMQAMITSVHSQLADPTALHFVDFVRVQREERVQTRNRQRQRPPQPEAPPPSQIPPRVDAMAPATVDVNVAPPEVDTRLEIGGFAGAAGDGEYLPIVKIAPVYPMTARRRQIEGHVIVEYTVTKTGSVRDVRIIEAEPPNIFDHVSIEAALKFKYKPRIVDGEPIEVYGVRNIFRYRLNQG
jgi:protein TonB